MRSRVWWCTTLLVIGLAAVTGCARSPEAKKAQYLGRADGYFEAHKYSEAIIEYMNVLRLDGDNRQAITRLGLAHYELAQLGQAFPYLLKARELDPGQNDVRFKLGTIFLLGRRTKEARDEATAILDKDPRNFDALVLSAATVATRAEVDTEIRRLEDARDLFADRAKFHMSLGMLYLRKQAPDAAERALREAVARESKSAEAHLLLADFYVSRLDTAQAEREYAAAADLGPVGSFARLKLAEFYLAMQRPDDGKRVLRSITEKAPEFLPAWRRLAEVAVAEGRYDDADKDLTAVFKKSPADFEGHLLSGRIHLARGQVAEAVQELQGVLKVEPRFAPARYHLALARAQAGNIQQAKAELADIAVDYPDAALLLADLHLQTGALEPAVETLQRLLAKQPNFQGYVLLGWAYLRKGEPTKATAAFQNIVTRAPKDPRGPYFVGLALRAQAKTAEARRAFEDALALLPDYVDPMSQLVAMALDERRPDAALARLERQIAQAPNSAGLRFLLGRLQERRGARGLAEHAYLEAIRLQPSLIGGYVALGQLYATGGDYGRALGKIHEALTRNPKDVSAQMLAAVIYERQGDMAKAQTAYEAVLTQNPRFAPAANNLAYLYSQYGGDKNRALELAQLAKQVAPDEPRISDTLGWIMYKRGIYEPALGLLRDSAGKLPDNPEVQYHLGMTYAKLGLKEQAKAALLKAVGAGGDFTGKDEAERTLQQL